MTIADGRQSIALHPESFRAARIFASVPCTGTSRVPDGYRLGSYRIATAPEPNSSRLTSFKSIRFDSPANNVGPWPARLC
jgi:hypothetical protein